jgi:uncharacterized protein (TIGR03086 family)
MDQAEMMERVLNQADRIVQKIEPSQMGNETPCTEWSARDVINHMVGGITMFSECVENGSVPDERLGELMGGADLLGDDPKSVFSAACKRAIATFGKPGAMEQTVTLPFGVMPAGVALNIGIMDVTTHACDLAKATGLKIDDTELLDVALETGKQLIGPDFRKPGIFGPEQPAPAGASAGDKLLAFAGRKV